MIQDLWNGLLDFTTPLVVPDWGSLIGLIPLGLAALVVLYLVTTIRRFATAGPTHRGVHRLEPIAPAGIHMPGPSFAPILGAFGLFMLMFGLFAHGPWLAVGLVVLVITLLYWGREALRDYDRVAAADDGTRVIGMLQAPAGTPPEGVHMPPPSFRPLLLATAMTILVGGMVVGGWGLLFGIVALALVLVGWLRDAKRDYHAVETADVTGHLDLGGGPAWPTSTFAVLAALIAVTAILSSGILPNSHPATAGASPAANGAGGGAPASSAPSGPAADATITAQGLNFTTTAVDVPAGKAFTLAFNNQDAGTPHNVEIKDASGKSVFKGDIVTGAIVKVYDVPALAAGTYSFACTVHPNMTGTITAK